jgi:uncharacterized protein (TIGR04255 family)
MKKIDPQNIKYPKNFLKSVIFRVDFNPILSIKESLNTNFHDQIRSAFPKLQLQQEHQILAEIKDGETTSKTETFNQYLLSNENDKRKLTVSTQFIILEILDFTGFVDLKDQIKSVIDNFQKSYSPISVTRLGLRYINEIKIKRGSPYSWDGYINKSLLNLLSSDLIVREETSRIMSQIVYKKDDFNTTFSFGIANSEFPNPISRKEFILDYDCYSNEVDYDKINSLINDFNSNMVILFENSIDDKLRTILKGEQDE